MIRSDKARHLDGWFLVIMAALLAALALLLPLLLQADLVEGTRQGIRVTARLSLVLFLLAFTASAVRHFRPGPFADWQIRNRRYFGLGLGVSHLAHLVGIVAFARLAPPLFWADRTVLGNVPGTIGYLVLALMVATSFRGPAAWLGPRGWRLLHGIGVWILWLLFVGGLRSHNTGEADYAVLIGLAVAAAGLRLAHMVGRVLAGRGRAGAGSDPAR